MAAAVAVPGIAILHSCVDFSLQIPAIAFISAAFLGMGWAQTFHRTPAGNSLPLPRRRNKLITSWVQSVCLGHTDWGRFGVFLRGSRPGWASRAWYAWRLARVKERVLREAMPAEAEQPSTAGRRSSRGKPAIRSAPERFFETWLDALGGFLFCVVLPIPIYATGEPFAKGIGATEQTILATAVGLRDRVVLRPPARCVSARHPAGQRRLRGAGRRAHLRRRSPSSCCCCAPTIRASSCSARAC